MREWCLFGTPAEHQFYLNISVCSETLKPRSYVEWNSPKNSRCKRSFLVTLDNSTGGKVVQSAASAAFLLPVTDSWEIGSFLEYLFSLIKQFKDRLKWKFEDSVISVGKKTFQWRPAADAATAERKRMMERRKKKHGVCIKLTWCHLYLMKWIIILLVSLAWLTMNLLI